MTETEQRKPNEQDKVTIAEYVQDAKLRGFCKIDVPSRDRIQLFNRFADDRDAIRSFAYLAEDFREWLHENKRECEFREVSYIARTLPLIVGTKFVPGGDDISPDKRTGFKYANTYRRYQPKITSDEVSPLFHEFFKRLVPDDRERSIFLQWLGHLFQCPQQRPSWHILVPSEPGTGKGFLLESILHPLLYHTVVARSFKAVMGQFSSVLENSLLILLDDCKSGSDSTQTQLKSILSEERQYVEKKHQQGAMVPTYTRFILASNEEKPLHLEEDERRWFVLSRAVHEVDRFETQAFIQKLADWLNESGSLCKVWNYFNSISLEGFNHKAAPESVGLAAIVEMSRNPYADAIADFTTKSKVFTYAELVTGLKELGFSKPTDRELGHLIRENGFTKARLTVEGDQSWLYFRKGTPEEEVKRLRIAQTSFA